MLSKKAKNLKPSPTLELAAKAKELKAKGLDVVSLTVGEPDWESAPSACEAGIKAIQSGITRYTPAAGTIALRESIAKFTNNHLNLDYTSKNITVGSGAKFIIFAALETLLDPGDEVIIPAPYWVSYPTMVEMADGKPIIVTGSSDNDFKITPKSLSESITLKTKMLMLNSPSNPTGAEYSQSELDQLAEVIRQNKQLVVLSDDIYNQLSFTGSALSPHILKNSPDLKDRVVMINGMSKAYAMTGWRLGWGAGSPEIIKAMASYQSQTTGAPSSISQAAAQAALEATGEVKLALASLNKRRDFALEQFKTIPGLKVFSPQGAFYLWVNVGEIMNKSFKGKVLSDSRSLAKILLEEKNLVIVPGQEFGMDGFFRASFAVDKETMSKASTRLKEFVSELTN